MKTSKIILSFILFCIGTTSAQVKDSIIDRNVTVEREYKPVIQNAGKINTSPKMLELNVQKAVPKYSDFNLPLNADFNIHALPSAELVLEKNRIAKGGFARLGLGNYLNSVADFAYPIVKMSDMRLDFSLNHLGTFDDKIHSTTNAALAFDKYFKKFNLYAGLNVGHEYFKYYGKEFNSRNKTVIFDSLLTNYGDIIYKEKNREGIDNSKRTLRLSDLTNDSTFETFWRVNALIGFKSLPMTEGLKYLAEIQYKSFNAHNGLSENHLQTTANISTEYMNNRVGLDIVLNNMTYKSKSATTLNYWDAYSVYTLNPYYSIETKNYDVRLGVKSSFTFAQSKIQINPSMDIHAELKAIPKYLSIYGGLTGSQELNTLNKTFAENRFLASDIRIKDTYTPLEFYAGVKLKPIYNLLLDANINYKNINNQYFFVNKGYNSTTILSEDSTLYSNRFDVLYSNATLTKLSLRANYNYRNKVNVEIKYAYNNWVVKNEQYAWNKPKWEMNLNTDIKITNDLSFNANLFLESERFAKLGSMAVRMRPKVDVNIGASYSTNSWFTAFAKVNNLINNPYETYYGYQVQGLNALVGVAFSF